MCQVKHMLWQTRTLDDTANLDSTLFFDEFADGEKKGWRELLLVSVTPL